MGGRVAAKLALVARGGQQLVVARDHRADRHVAVLGRLRRLCERKAHHPFVTGRAHGASIGQRQLPRSFRVGRTRGRRSAGPQPRMNSNGLRTTLVGACAMLAIAALPAAAGAQEPYVPGQAVVGLRDGATEVMSVPEGAGMHRWLRELRRLPGVRSAGRNWTATASIAPLDQGSTLTPGGWAADQWNLGPRPGGIQVESAWDRLIAAGATGGGGVTVAVVDSGIAYTEDATHSPSPDFLPTRFVPGIDLVDDDSTPEDENGHGTFVAGTIGEQITIGTPATAPDYLTGIAYGASLMPVRVLDAGGVGSTDDVAAGILWAARNGADVINLSLNFDPAVKSCRQVPTVCSAIRQAKRLGALVVGAAGNVLDGPGGDRAYFPAAAPGALGVGATTRDGCLAAYSDYGRRTDLLAPGGGPARRGGARPDCTDDSEPIYQLTYSCFPNDCTGGRQRFAIRPDIGTSMAAAHASGVAALVLASRVSGDDPSPSRVTKRLRCTARTSRPKRFYADGMLDARRALDPRRHCDAPRNSGLR